MKIYRRNKMFEVMDGIKSLKMFDNMDDARDYVRKNGNFTAHQKRDWKNTSRYDNNYAKHVWSVVDIEREVLDEAYKNYRGISDFDKF